jgi:hypothetical protein
MWVQPVSTVRSVVDTALGYAGTVSESSEYFLGQAVENAGLWFYPVSLAFRSTPLLWLGLVALALLSGRAWWRLIRRRQWGWRESNPESWFCALMLGTFAGLFCVFMSLATKKFDRYMLPVVVALDILAAVGLTHWLPHVRQPVAWTLLAITLVVQSAFVLAYQPYYLAYYNPLVGGSRTAPRVMPLGWGEAMNLAASYLNGKSNAEQLSVATGGIPGFAPYFSGRVEPLTARGLATSDYAVLYISDIQQNTPMVQALSAQKPEAILRIRDMDYVWIFPNVDLPGLEAFLASEVGAEETVLLDAWSPLHRDSPELTRVLEARTEDEVVAQLGSTAAQYRSLWYVHYPEADTQGWINEQLATHALLLERQTLGQVAVSHYCLPSATAFSRPNMCTEVVSFGGKLRLAGYGLDAQSVEYRQALGVTLRWQSQGAVAEDYALSLRLLDEQGRTWAQDDQWLLDDRGAGSSGWMPGEITEKRHLLSIPAGIPPGNYAVTAVVYDAHSLQQTAVQDATGSVIGTEHRITQVQVAPPAVPPTMQELPIAHPLQAEWGPLELLGFDLPALDVKPGQTLDLSLCWMASEPVGRACTQVLTLGDGDGQVWAQGSSLLGGESYPTDWWREGEPVEQRSELHIGAEVPSGTYSLLVNVLCKDEQDSSSVAVAMAELNVRGRDHLFAAPEIPVPAQAQLGDLVQLLGIGVATPTAEPGSSLHLTLYWQPAAQTDRSYKVFTHLLDEQNRIWGQQDGTPCGGGCPTSSWVQGEYLIDEYAIAISPEAPAGEYVIGVGLYDELTMLRLPAMTDARTRWADDRVILPVRITVVNSAGE